MFFRHYTYTPIPEQLKIYYGDDWIFNTHHFSGKNNYHIANLLHYTPFAVSTGKIENVNAIHAIEQPIYQKAFEEFLRNKND